MFGYVMYWISAPALIIIALTMFARANDLRWQKGWHQQLRLVGFVLAGAAPVGVLVYNWTSREFPTPYEVMLYVGCAAVFFTTPNLPPWWEWVSRGAIDPPHNRRSTDNADQG